MFAVACGAGTESSSTTAEPATLPSTSTLAGSLDCPERNIGMEPSTRGFASPQTAAESALLETTWTDASLEEIETNQWIGIVEDRNVVRFRTFRNEDDTWEWINLEYC
jgi:hypothetical protein